MMKNKGLIIGGVVFFLLAGAIFAFLKIRSASFDKNMVTTVDDRTTPGKLLGDQGLADKYILWNDPAGFTFAYPEGWLIETHEQDVANYANLDITKRGEVGGIKIVATDSKYKTSIDWAKKDSLVASASLVETTVGGISAQKALLKSGEVIIGVIDEGVLYTFALQTGESGYWKTEYDKLLTSFKFVYPTNFPAKANSNSQAASAGGSSDGTVEELEEIVE